MTFVYKILNIVPAIIGIVQAVLPLLKELVVTVVRIIAILPILWNSDEAIIDKVNEIYDAIYLWVEKIKNFLLFIK
jgi:hypothetical protein